MPLQKLRALVVSPSASHPRDYGNRNRVWQTTSFLKRLGYEITFVLYPLEADWQNAIPRAYSDMKTEWEEVVVIPPSIPLHQLARGDYHEIDEWWDPEMGHYLSWLFKRKFFDVAFVNYSFLSKALALAPKITVKILDTHDLFSGRKEMLAANGVAPEFFYTTPEQERIAFDRADLVLAIKDSERDIIRSMTRRAVLSLPFYPAEPPAATAAEEITNPELRRPHGDEDLLVGFIGAENSVNIANMRRFLEEMSRLLLVYTPPSLRIVVAGNVCRGLWTDSPAIRLIGPVEDLAEFYGAVDIVVAPLTFSTGIKVKVGEALAYGKPVVSTANGFDGYPAFDPFHRLPDVTGVCRALIRLACDPERRALLAERSARSARMAALATAGSLHRLKGALHDRVRRIAFITDKPFWRRDTLWHERLFQWHDLLSYLAPLVCIAIGDHPDLPAAEQNTLPGSFARAELGPGSRRTGEAPDLGAVIAAMRSFGTVHLVVSAGRAAAAEVAALAADAGCALVIDNWGEAEGALGAAGPDAAAVRPGGADLAIHGVANGPLALTTLPLRYLPGRLAHWSRAGEGQHAVVALCSGELELRAELEFIAARLQLAGRTVTIVGGEGEPLAAVSHARFLSWAATVAHIDAMILLGSDQRLLRLYRATASHLRIPCEDLSPERFPQLHADAAGRAVVVGSGPALLERMLAQGSEIRSPAMNDQGWNVLWRTLEAA